MNICLSYVITFQIIALLIIHSMNEVYDLFMEVSYYNTVRILLLFVFVVGKLFSIHIITFQINNNIIEFKSQGMELDVERQGILRLLEERQNEAQAKANEYEQKCKEVAKILDQLQAGMDYFKKKMTILISLLNV